MTTLRTEDTVLLKLFNEVISNVTKDVVAVNSPCTVTCPLHLCTWAAANGQFRLQLSMYKGRQGEVQQVQKTIALLDVILGPLVGNNHRIEILEYSYGQYAQFFLEVDTRASQYRVLKSMRGKEWALIEEISLENILQYIQRHIYVAADDGTGVSLR